MVKVVNKVVFIRKPVGARDQEFQISSNEQGGLKKKISRVKKLKIKEDITVKLTGSYKAYEVEVTPKDSPHASKLMGILKKKK